MPNFDTIANGDPTPAHKWDEQFKVKGERLGRPTVEKLRERIMQLKTAIDANQGDNARKRTDGWERELAWRMRQLSELSDAHTG